MRVSERTSSMSSGRASTRGRPLPPRRPLHASRCALSRLSVRRRACSVHQATRISLRSTWRQSCTGTGAALGSIPSSPAMTRSARSKSSTLRAIGPMTVRESSIGSMTGKCPVTGTRPVVGLIVATPQRWAGCRRLPPESDPSPRAEPPAATMAASPLELPPGDLVRSWGLKVGPYTSLSVITFVLPRTMAPACRSRDTAVASSVGTRSRNAGSPPVQGRPATSIQSLIVTGTPWRRPSGAPLLSTSRLRGPRQERRRRPEPPLR